MKIFFSGGGTLGPVTPLLAIYETLKKQYPDIEAVWFGTKYGPEKELIESRGIGFITLPSGKLRRYLSIWNITDTIKIVYGFFCSIKWIWKLNPDICISAGGFVSVPLHWASWLFGVPSWIHQQDVGVGMSNRLMSPFARVITVSMKTHLKKFSKRKTVWLGNPVRDEVLSTTREQGIKFFKLDPTKPVIFATGGGTGSLRVNQLIMESVAHMAGIAQVIHLSGKERPQELVEHLQHAFSSYYQMYQFFTDEMKYAYAVADIVISRGGFGTLTEIAALKKPAIIIPKPGHQEQNVEYLAKEGAIVNVNEDTADGNYLAKIIKGLLSDPTKMKQMGEKLCELMPRATSKDIVGIFEKVVKR